MPTRAEWREAIRHRWPLLWRSILVVAIASGVIALWQVYNLEAYTKLGRLLEFGGWLREQAWAVPAVILLYVIAGIAFLPLTVMVVATILIYGPVGGFLLANAGTIATALSGFLLGRMLGAEPLRRLGGPTLQRLNAQAGEHGTMIVTAMRVMPVAHFHAMSLLSGASAIGFWPYLTGTLIGTVPGIAIIAAVGNQTKRLLLDPDLTGLAVLTGLGVLSFGIFYALRRWMRRYAGADQRHRDVG